mmetsp:Transcript_50626/g.100127  ORF Transcript_50626/g.100127 Transcript_50626/m.100127 type:complete len:96 (-) Transcript_50626:230-517(-)
MHARSTAAATVSAYMAASHATKLKVGSAARKACSDQEGRDQEGGEEDDGSADDDEKSGDDGNRGDCGKDALPFSCSASSGLPLRQARWPLLCLRC